jgi:hypothetical protein
MGYGGGKVFYTELAPVRIPYTDIYNVVLVASQCSYLHYLTNHARSRDLNSAFLYNSGVLYTPDR